jgi:uncharacterized protein (TIGR00299 family) protein
MLLGAFLDAGCSFERLQEELRALPIVGYELKLSSYSDQGITGSRFEVILTEQEQPTRSFTDITALIASSRLSSYVKEKASAIFRTLGEAEAAVHGVTLAEIHFHEVGAIDSIVDIVGNTIAIEALGITQLYASPLPLTRGHLRMAHGLMPVPAPATLEILSAVKAPWVPAPLEGELVTPTGAAILATLAHFETPAIAIERVGYGFGQKRLIWPNCLRACLGETYGLTSHAVEHQHDDNQSAHKHHHTDDHDVHEHQHAE